MKKLSVLIFLSVFVAATDSNVANYGLSWSSFVYGAFIASFMAGAYAFARVSAMREKDN
jgi:hypothetical protein